MLRLICKRRRLINVCRLKSKCRSLTSCFFADTSADTAQGKGLFGFLAKLTSPLVAECLINYLGRLLRILPSSLKTSRFSNTLVITRVPVQLTKNTINLREGLPLYSSQIFHISETEFTITRHLTKRLHSNGSSTTG